jgi:hypothetical protein
MKGLSKRISLKDPHLCFPLSAVSRNCLTEVKWHSDSLISREMEWLLEVSEFPTLESSMRTGFTTGNIESKVRSSRDVRTLCFDKTFAFGSIAVTVEEK